MRLVSQEELWIWKAVDVDNSWKLSYEISTNQPTDWTGREVYRPIPV